MAANARAQTRRNASSFSLPDAAFHGDIDEAAATGFVDQPWRMVAARHHLAMTSLVDAEGHMPAAAFALVVNIAVAGLFAASFAVLALTNTTQRKALWFSASYAIGMLTPLSEFFLPISPWPEFFTATSYASFAAGLLATAAALATFYGQPIPWRTIPWSSSAPWRCDG
ncbi:MAG: hypothetical protein ACXWLB_19475 [Reyranella sp.]